MIFFFFFFFNDTATTEIYTLSLHDALPILNFASFDQLVTRALRTSDECRRRLKTNPPPPPTFVRRSEEHTSELQSLAYLVCRLLLEKKKQEVSRNCVNLPVRQILAHLTHAT